MGPLRRITRTVPIVFTETSDPVGAGFIESLGVPTSTPMRRMRSLLRARYDRHRSRRAAEQRDELAAFHGRPRCASQQKLRDDVADGSKAAKLRMSKYFPVCPQKRTFDLRVYESIPN